MTIGVALVAPATVMLGPPMAVGTSPGTGPVIQAPSTSNTFGGRAACRCCSFSARSNASNAVYGVERTGFNGSALGSSQPNLLAFATTKLRSEEHTSELQSLRHL